MQSRKNWNRSGVLALAACVGLAAPALAQDVKPVASQPTPAKAPPQLDPHNHGAHIQPSDASLSPLTWDSMSHDFGNIPDTAPVTHVFKFTNKTDKRVTIQSANGSCGCTVPALQKKTYEPGESGEMTVTFNPQSRRGPQPKQITVTYAEPPGTPPTMLTITSNVQPLMVIEPLKMYLMDVDSRTGKSTEVLVSGRKADFVVQSVETVSPHLDVRVGEKREVQIDGQPFQQYPISVTVKPNTPLGEFQTELVIKTNEESSPTTNYMFVADVVGELKATPAKLTLRAYTPNVAFANVVTLETRSGKPFRVTSVDVEGREDMQLVVDVEPSTLTGKPAYTVRLNGVTPDVTGMVTGEIIVKTDLPENPEIRLPFSSSIRGSASRPQVVPTSH